MQKLVLLMTFWFSDETKDKLTTWHTFTSFPVTEDSLFVIIAYVINGIDNKIVNWSAMKDFVESMHRKTGIVVDHVPDKPVAKPKKVKQNG
jgi:hypothetical protein